MFGANPRPVIGPIPSKTVDLSQYKTPQDALDAMMADAKRMHRTPNGRPRKKPISKKAGKMDPTGIPFRAIAVLKERGPMATTELAAALDVSANSVNSGLHRWLGREFYVHGKMPTPDAGRLQNVWGLIQ